MFFQPMTYTEQHQPRTMKISQDKTVEHQSRRLMIKILVECDGKTIDFRVLEKYLKFCNVNYDKCLTPSEYLILDETLSLSLMRNKVSMKNYNPHKPANYGMRFQSINDARFSYTYCSYPYCVTPKSEQPGQYYVRETKNTMKHLFTQLELQVDLQSRNILHDCLYTSINLAIWLLEKNVTSLGILLSNRRGIPAEVKSTTGREVNFYEYF